MQTPAFRNPSLKILASILLGLTLTACGGGDGDSRLDGNPGTNPDTNPGGGGNGGGDGEDNEPAQLGSGSGDEFVAGEIGVGIGDSTLSPGGTTSLTVTLVNSQGELITNSVSITFNSDCIAEGGALLSGTDEEGGNSVTTNNGRAEVAYTANGCAGEDSITARSIYEGVSAGSARATINIGADTVQSLEFTRAEPELINLKGSGGVETSTVTFTVRGSTGRPMRGVEVSFGLATAPGGLALVNDSDTTNTQGEASTTIQAGEVATPIVLLVSTPEVSTQVHSLSHRLAVTTGIADQSSTSLSGSQLFPTALRPQYSRYDGVESEITIRLADQYNNPPIDGTTVTFTTSGGSVDSSCKTENGSCTVTWRSHSPVPIPSQDFVVNETTLKVDCPTEAECRPGHVQILATALGNESFIDLNGNGQYDHEVDLFGTTTSGGDCSPNRPRPTAERDELGCDDLGSAYLDRNFNKTRDSNEQIVDLTGDGNYREGDGIYNGSLCSSESLEAGECTRDLVTIRDDLLLVMACDQPFLVDGRLPGQQESVNVGAEEQNGFNMLLIDCNGNGMPPGTTVEVIAESGEDVEIETTLVGELPGKVNGTEFSVLVQGTSETDPPSGSFRFLITAPTPNGDVSVATKSVSITN